MASEDNNKLLRRAGAMDVPDDGADHLRADILGSIAGSDPRRSDYFGRINNLLTAFGAVGNDGAATMMKSPSPTTAVPVSDSSASMKSPSPAMDTSTPDLGTLPAPGGPLETTPAVMGPAKPQRSLLGRIGGVAARMGNIAGDILAPAVTANIPGTDLYKAAKAEKAEAATERQRKLTTEETKAAAEKERADTEAEALRKPAEKTTDEQALAARQRILATPEGQAPDPKDVATWNAYADLEKAKQGAKPTDENKQPVGDAGVTQHGKQLETLTSGMNAEEKKRFLDAYNVSPNDQLGVATKRLEDAKAAAQLTGAERDRALQRGIAEKNHQDAVAQRQMESGSEIVRAVDKQNRVHLLSRADYEANKGNYTGSVMKLNPDALKQANDHATAINEMQARTNAMADAVRAFNWSDSGQKSIVKQALAHSNDQNYVDQILGIPVAQWTAANVKQWGLEGATPETRDYIISALSMREAALAMPKEITGGSRSTQQAVSALWNTLPEGATPNADWALKQLKTFQSVTDRLKRTRVPAVPGLPEEPVHPVLQSGGTHNFTVNGVGYTGVSDEDYAKAKKLKGFKE